ncbi:MAG TPA: P63C domain-containing protein [Candidatus Acidoferrum sp.]|nr:P63C domain-containing protein [Candidatus Acidoferrum sp.]
MTEEMSIQKLGGDARAAKLSPGERKEIAKNAANARWNANLLRATHDGPLQIGDSTLMAAVLPNGKRLIVQGTMLTAIGRSRTPKAGTGGSVNVDGLPFFLSAEALKPFITDDLRLSTTPILFRLKGGQRAVGYDALLLPQVCKVYQDLRNSLMGKLASEDEKAIKEARPIYAKYKHIIERCDELSHGFGQRGILALVDDATGYQDDKVRQDIDRIIKAYVAPGLAPWVQKFPHSFFRETYRLLGWEYKAGQTRHSPYMGKFINKYVFEALPPGVLDELKARLPKNEKGNRRAKLWQLLTVDTGIPHLDRQLTADLTLMQVSETKLQFEEYWDKLFGKQPRLPLTMLKEIEDK